ncbi:hypothetical protein [Marinilabilia sp.]|uniref:hypothetical protein n=1 Tax=Marinilabilia sp. TaxID=2021252 RepID=UPI0025BEC807|nr:hypothetical protein [Marinilabilia sp.]
MDPVTENEKALKQWKEETRRDALENEVERLKAVTQNQSGKIKNISIALIVAVAILATSLIAFFSVKTGKKNEQVTTSLESTEAETTNPPSQPKNRELTIISPLSDTIKFQIPENGIIFSIQIGAFIGQDLAKFNDNMITLHQHSSENINQFTLGLFTSYQEALEFKEMVNTIGFKDAYVTALKDGKRIKIQEALKYDNTQ